MTKTFLTPYMPERINLFPVFQDKTNHPIASFLLTQVIKLLHVIYSNWKVNSSKLIFSWKKVYVRHIFFSFPCIGALILVGER